MRRSNNVRFVVALLAGACLVPAVAAPQGWGSILDKAKQAVTHGSTQGSAQPAANLSNSQVVEGLKETLADGTRHAIDTLGKKNGFWDNSAVRIPLPGALGKAAKLARAMGQGAKVDAFQLSMNRAAEKAVPQVADIFANAIRSMTLADARGILTGGDHAATDYFRRAAGPALTKRIEPIVAKATDSVGVTRKYKELVNGSTGGGIGATLSRLGGRSHGDTLNLDQYVTNKTIDGLFTEIGDEEKAIRTNPAARSTALLKKLFGD